MPCLSGISDGHAQDGYYLLVSPIHLGMSGTLLAMHCPEYFFVFELVEGKAHPRQAGPFEFEDLGKKTVGLFLRMMKSYFLTLVDM